MIIKKKSSYDFYTRNEQILMIVLLFISIYITGLLCNFQAVYKNGGRMPFVYEYEYQDDTHFSYQNASQVNYQILTDIIPIGEWGIFSIGDFCLLIGLIGFVSMLGWFKVRKYKEYREYKLLSSKPRRKIS